MSQREHRRDNLADLISDMESDVADLLAWALVVCDLGSSDNCEAKGVQVVGAAMEDVAKQLQTDWNAAFRLSRHLREVSR
ncbi:hypothetical protein MBRA_05884 [Methylobacterium brachiatum]|nr:hypothetical protein MBRA_05884 [Methylobacterium brachiatum]